MDQNPQNIHPSKTPRTTCSQHNSGLKALTLQIWWSSDVPYIGGQNLGGLFPSVSPNTFPFSNKTDVTLRSLTAS
ncbi:hypothetical protein L484_016162 [Morus notabilis]|uniref:Uncharacterized protein n=1 Tax=Morus notabilis TaxID=981085 RepID=W9QBQ9_9ROSA|nr:hypothetical protein L484_016162 [Morus notabilis]